MLRSPLLASGEGFPAVGAGCLVGVEEGGLAGSGQAPAPLR